jgi:hypothetical protein
MKPHACFTILASISLCAVAIVAAHAGASSGCSHDSPILQRHLFSGMDPVFPQGAAGGQNKKEEKGLTRGMLAQTTSATTTTTPFNITFATLDLFDPTKYCSSGGAASVPNFLGGTVSCSSETDFTPAVRSVLIDEILPLAASRITAALSLTKTPAATLMVPSGACGGFFNISSNHTTEGIEGAHYVMYVAASPSTGTWASHCSLASDNRPIVGRANVDPADIAAWSTAGQDAQQVTLNLITHHLLHALGFTNSLLQNKTALTTVRGKPSATEVQSPNVAAQAQKFFDCPTATGVELEDEEGTTTHSLSSHWEQRVLRDDVMSSGFSGTAVSQLTLAAMEDLGHYTANYSAADNSSVFGNQAGCGFLTSPCNTVEGGKDLYFCFSASTNSLNCTYNHEAVGACQVANLAGNAARPSYSQYFPDFPSLGGDIDSLNYMDGCPLVVAVTGGECSVARSATLDQLRLGHEFGAGSVCLETTGLVSGAWPATVGAAASPRCMKAECLEDGHRVAIKVGPNATHTYQDCPLNGDVGAVTASDFLNEVRCPKPLAVCHQGPDLSPPGPCDHLHTPALCYAHASATCYYWNTTGKACESLATIDNSTSPLSGFKVSTESPFPGEPFYVNLFGAGYSTGDSMGLLDASGGQGCASVSPTQWTWTSADVKGTLPLRTAQGAFEVNTTTATTFHVCYESTLYNQTFEVTSLVVEERPPVLERVVIHFDGSNTAGSSSSSIGRTAAYSGVGFTVSFEGMNLRSSDRFTFIAAGGSCPNVPPYTTIHQSNNHTETKGFFILNTTGVYDACYSNHQGASSAIPIQQLSGAVTVSGKAPYSDPALLTATADAVPVVTNSHPGAGMPSHAFNTLYCKSSSSNTNPGGARKLPESHPWGPFTNPHSDIVRYGTGTREYERLDRCVYVIRPGAAGATGFLNLKPHFTAFDAGDEVRVFLPAAASYKIDCNTHTSAAACAGQGCHWTTTAATTTTTPATSTPTTGGRCILGYDTTLNNCPTAFPGYRFALSLNHVRSQAAQWTALQTTYAEGAILAICSNNMTGAGSGLKWQYTATATPCLNNCSDINGISRGSCVISSLGEPACACHVGYGGVDCRANVDTNSSDHTESVVLSGGAGSYSKRTTVAGSSGILVQLDPSSGGGAAGLDRGFPEASYGLALKLTDVKLESIYKCRESLLQIRRGGLYGEILWESCSTLPTGSATTILLNTTESIYLHFRFIVGDGFALQYKVVSTVCPGVTPSPSGLPIAVCSGYGRCHTTDKPFDYDADDYTQQCDCHTGNHARSDFFDTCDVCTFGHHQLSYPTCAPITYCSVDSHCANGGTCNAGVGRCNCPAGVFGAQCNYTKSRVEIDGVASTLADNLQLWLSMDQYVENGVASGPSGPLSILPCALPGALFGCVAAPRTRGSVYTEDETLLPSLEVDLARRRRQHSSSDDSNNYNDDHRRRQINMTGNMTGNGTDVNASTVTTRGEDFGLSFNSVLPGGLLPYRDFARIEPVVGTGLADLTDEWTLTAWLKVTPETNGFLAAAVDGVFYPDGIPVALYRALNDVTDRHMASSDQQLGKDDAKVYWGIYLNGTGPEGTTGGEVTFVMSSRGERIIRHFRLYSEAEYNPPNLFDGTWRFFTFMVHFDTLNQQILAQVMIDAVTGNDSPQMVQCLPRRADPMDNAAPANINFNGDLLPSSSYVITQPGGSVVTGLRFVGEIDELRIYDTLASRVSLVSLGSEPLFGDTLAIAVDTLVAFGSICCVAIAGILIVRLLRIGGVMKNEKPTGKSDNDLRVTILFQVLDMFQVQALFMIGFSFPTPFQAVMGRFLQFMAFDITVIPNASFHLWVIFTNLFGLLAVIVLTVFVGIDVKSGALSKDQNAKEGDDDSAVNVRPVMVKEEGDDSNQQQQQGGDNRDGGKKKGGAECEDDDEEDGSSHNDKGIRNVIKLMRILIKFCDFIYIPVTRNAILLVGCHPSIWCLYDCGHGPAWKFMEGFSIIMFICITFWVWFIFIICHGLNKKHPNGQMKPYQPLYKPFEPTPWYPYKMVHLTMKMIMCACALGAKQNSLEQLILIVCFQAVYTVMCVGGEQYTKAKLNWVHEVAQVNILFSLALMCFFRAYPASELGVGWALNAATFLTLVAHFIIAVYPADDDDDESMTAQLKDEIKNHSKGKKEGEDEDEGMNVDGMKAKAEAAAEKHKEKLDAAKSKVQEHAGEAAVENAKAQAGGALEAANEKMKEARTSGNSNSPK